jgi:hypothetical protein
MLRTLQGVKTKMLARPRHLGKTKTSTKNETSHLARLKDNMVQARHPPHGMEDHGDIFMSFSVVNFKLMKIISNQLEYLFLLFIYN